MARGESKTATATATATSTTILIANQHTGPIMFPRKGGDGISQPPLILEPGTATELDKEEWNSRKAGEVVQHYLDRGILAEVTRTSNNVPMDPTSTDLPIPPNLQGDEQTGRDASASVRKIKNGSVTV